MPALSEPSIASDNIRDEVQGMQDGVFVSEAERAAKEELRQRFRQLAKDDLYFLAKAVLGYKDLTKRTHLPYARFLQNLENKRTLDLMPRGVYKTTIGTIAFSIWYLINYPNHTILIANQTAGNAERMLLEIEGHLDGGNVMMNWLFPEMIRPHARWKPWSSDKMTIPNRKVISGTPSITVLGVGAKAESQHFHVIINDDLIGDKAQASSSVMLDAIAWHDYSESLFVSPRDGIERMHGTRWGMGDLYGYIIQRPEYEVYEKAAIDEEGNLLFPELLDAETLRRLREKNFLMYLSQYMNNPSNPESLDFRKEWLNYYKLLRDDERGPYCLHGGKKYYVDEMSVGLFVDPAGSGDIEINAAKDARRAQYRLANNAVGVWGLHGSGLYFLLDLWCGRGQGENPELQVATKMYEMFVRWRGFVSKGYVEGYGAQAALITVFNMVCRQNNDMFLVEPIGRSNVKAKHVRIRSFIGPSAQERLICVRMVHDKFIEEFSQFPNGRSYDTLDMSAWAFYKLRKPNSSVEDEIYEEQHQRRRNAFIMRTGKTGY